MKKHTLFFVSALGFCSSATVLAQLDDPVSTGFIYKLKGNVDGGGDISFQRWFVKAGVPLYKSDRLFVAFGGGYIEDKHDFSGGWNPWGTIRYASVALPLRYKINDQWDWKAVATFSSSAERGAERSDASTWGFISAWDYKVSETLKIGPGIAYIEQLEDSASIFPLISLEWKFKPNWMLATGPGEAGTTGANIYLQYNPDNKWTFTTGVGYSNSRFRLSEKNAMMPDGIGEDTFAVAYGVAKYRATENFSVSLIGGYMFAGEYTMHNQKGREVEQRDTDASPVIGMSLNYEF